MRFAVTGCGRKECLFRATVVVSFAALALVALLACIGFYSAAAPSAVTVTLPTAEESIFVRRLGTNDSVPKEAVLSETFMRRQNAQDKAEAPRVTAESSEGSEDFETPRVALLFLSRAELHNEPIWRAFFEAAGRLRFRHRPPKRPYSSFVKGDGEEIFNEIDTWTARRLQQTESIQNILACDAEPEYLAPEVKRLLSTPDVTPDLISRQKLFSVYTHPSPDYHFPNNSLFYGTEIEDRVDTSQAWGSFALVAAEIKLLRAAFQHVSNQKFVLLSEACVPLHRPELIYLQLLSEEKSRINSCHPFDGQHQLSSRWDGRMKTPYLKPETWRKSSQWFALRRSHAELIASDAHVKDKFKSFCRRVRGRLCVPDEHYIATTIAVYGLGDETTCRGSVTACWWPTSGRAHPVAFAPRNINPILFKKLRHMASCQVGTAQASTQSVFTETRDDADRCLYYNNTDAHFLPPPDADDWIVRAGYRPLGDDCPLFARKFNKVAVRQTLRAALACAGSALGYWC